jgi:hypothetical protein
MQAYHELCAVGMSYLMSKGVDMHVMVALWASSPRVAPRFLHAQVVEILTVSMAYP